MILAMTLIGCGPHERLSDPGSHPERPCDSDDDGDGVGVCKDNCIDQSNADQADADRDGIGDACDDCSAEVDGLGDRCGCTEPVRCTDGAAGAYACDEVDLLSFVPLSDVGAGSTNDVWGWTDPDSGEEYVLLGLDNGVVFLDVTDPFCPVHVGTLRSSTGSSSWRDLETWRDHLYVGSEAPGHGVQVFDLGHLAEFDGESVAFEPDAVYTGVGSSHTITVDPVGGYLSANGSDRCEGGLHLVDLANPGAPVFGACSPVPGYVHDAQCVTYHGPDTEHDGASICVTANGASGSIGVIDVSDLAHPLELADVDYVAEGAVYAHQGWFTEDHAWFVFGDELDEAARGVDTTTWVFDLRDLDRPALVGRTVQGTTSIDHQQYVRGNRVYQSNYTSGLRILDLADVATAELEEIASFDVYPGDDEPKFEGSWSNYPWFESGVVPVTSIHEGLFLLRPHFDP